MSSWLQVFRWVMGWLGTLLALAVGAGVGLGTALLVGLLFAASGVADCACASPVSVAAGLAFGGVAYIATAALVDAERG